MGGGFHAGVEDEYSASLISNARKQFEQTKELLTQETHDVPGSKDLIVTPILHNNHIIYLQFNGWSINLHPDGTWRW